MSKIDGFWPQALTNCVATNVYIDDDDQQLLNSLSKIDVKRNADDLRGARIEFHFQPNDFISDAVLVKEFKPDPEAGEFTTKFDFAADTVPVKTQISWKSDDKNLCKLKPTVGDLKENEGDEDDEEPDFEPGSFFSSFFDSESRQVAGSIGRAIVEELFPFAIEHFKGETDDDEAFDEDEDEEDDDEEDEEDEEDDDREIDLEEEERPKKKGRK